jgi:hypothetical protein
VKRWRRCASPPIASRPIRRTRQLRADMSNLFERLFLDGEADQLEPIQALGLFYEFSDLTPVGPNGDRIVRLLAGGLCMSISWSRRRNCCSTKSMSACTGVGKAQVAADLAAIYLMDRKPDRALGRARVVAAAKYVPANVFGRSSHS